MNLIQDVGLPTDEKLRDLNSDLNKSLYDFLKSIDSYTAYDSYLNYYSKFSGMGFSLFLFGLEISLRNLPARVLKLTFASFEGTYIKGTLVRLCKSRKTNSLTKR
jgi:hypothetical protein